MHSASKEKKSERFIAVQGLQQQPITCDNIHLNDVARM